MSPTTVAYALQEAGVTRENYSGSRKESKYAKKQKVHLAENKPALTLPAISVELDFIKPAGVQKAEDALAKAKDALRLAEEQHRSLAAEDVTYGKIKASCAEKVGATKKEIPVAEKVLNAYKGHIGPFFTDLERKTWEAFGEFTTQEIIMQKWVELQARFPELKELVDDGVKAEQAFKDAEAAHRVAMELYAAADQDCIESKCRLSISAEEVAAAREVVAKKEAALKAARKRGANAVLKQ